MEQNEELNSLRNKVIELNRDIETLHMEIASMQEHMEEVKKSARKIVKEACGKYDTLAHYSVMQHSAIEVAREKLQQLGMDPYEIIPKVTQ